tara:strand:+ start:435 stop:611 length:177 start_codon:yes stop_codon:yes gene_type:complete
MFAVGALLAGIPMLIMFSGTMHFGPDSIVIVLPFGIGVALLLISGTKALKKFDRYMDR